MENHSPMRIENHILKTELLDIEQLTPLQGGLKKLSDENFNKLRQSLIDKGFQFTVHVWESGGVTYIIDGHQRVHVMKQMRKGGWEIPAITCSFVKAATYHEAKELILYSISQYGKVDQEGWTEFTMGEDFDFSRFDIPSFTIDMPIDWDSDLHKSQSDFDSVESNIDGITATVKVKCPQDLAGNVRAAINDLIDSMDWEEVTVA